MPASGTAHRGRTRPGAGLAVCHGQQLLERRLPDHCERLPLQVTGTIHSLPRVSTMPEQGQLQRFEFRADSISPVDCAPPRTLLLNYRGEVRLVPGERWRFEVLLRRPWGLVNPGSFNMQAWYAQTGIDAVGSVRSTAPARRLASAEGRAWHHRLRQSLSGQIRAALGDTPEGAVLRALTVADRSGLDHPLWTLFQQFGISHLLVISGLHVGLVAACGLGLGTLLARSLALTGCNRSLVLFAPLLAMVLASGYTALAGFSLATSRAWIMLSCFLLATLCGRPGLSWNNLLLAAAGLLCLNPLAALGAGFWLSFGSVACLLWLSLWWPRAGRAGRWLGTHAYMCLAMLPLGSWWFGGASQVAALANAVLVPLTGFFVVPLTLLAATLSALNESWAAGIWRLAAWPLQLLLPGARQFAVDYPHWLYSELMPTGPTVFLALVVLALVAVPLGARIRVLLPLLLLPLLLPTTLHRVAAPGAVHVVALDVGQGTAVLVYDARNVLLYDTGGGMPGSPDVATTVILPFMRSRGLRHIDTLVVSHGDADHSAGLDSLLGKLPVERLLTGPDVEAGSRGESCRAGTAWQWRAPVQFQVLAPAVGEQLDANGGSCVLRAGIGRFSLLLPGTSAVTGSVSWYATGRRICAVRSLWRPTMAVPAHPHGPG
ncbi:DNA internalization-related competence protein ComEC/Rec2 [Kineobactrum salinum]|uniref:DNA internalization-related competence protein ComEC/Rec2 n=1 Tax=Kineobactrum salinum TaxID=2708301 RepID=A0A6C0U5C0_9GAMM|nr:DNA internalization-related competence protein ComEC/Rec2 [Kineobactrum salinum]QIB67362.1 DNA internalization-related competence protein ComEC/Rec2 [Kineobactrum salinum]